MNSVELLSLDPKTKSSKEIIVKALGNRWPLSAKEIHSSLVREYGLQSTYQAIHKSVQELESEGIIAKTDKKYALDRNWIEKSRNYFQSLNRSYEKNESMAEDEMTIKYNNYTDFPLMLGNIFNTKKFAVTKDPDVYAMTRHLYWPLKFNFKDFELCKSVGANARPHIVCSKDSPFDRLIQKYYKIAKWPAAIIGSDIETEEDIIVQGHTIVQIKFSGRTKQKLDEIYSKVTSMADLFKQYIKNNANYLEIEVKITQNPQLAEMARQNIKKEMEAKE